MLLLKTTLQIKDRVHKVQKPVRKYAAAALSRGDKRVQVVQDRVQSVHRNGQAAELLSDRSPEIIVIR